MALTQFNQWEPRLDPVNGVMAQEPRLFAHDAVAVVVGAINNSDSNHGLKVTNYGSGYSVNDVITLSAPAGGGTTATVTVSKINAPEVTVLNDDLIAAATTNQTDFVDNSYTGTVGVTAGYSTSGAGTGLIITVTVAGNTATKVNVDSVGTGFAAGDTITITGSGGVLGGVTGNLVLTLGKGSITDYEMTNVGSTYTINEAFTQGGVAPAGGTGFAGNVSNIDIPNTQKRGACLYIGAAAGLSTLSVVMESGNTAVFNTISGGTVLPILVKRVTTGGLAANDVIALF